MEAKKILFPPQLFENKKSFFFNLAGLTNDDGRVGWGRRNTDSSCPWRRHIFSLPE